MSSQLTLVRDALQLLLTATRNVNVDRHRLPQSTQDALDEAMPVAIRALEATAFVAPQHFPAEFMTRDGRPAQLLGRHEDNLIGIVIKPGDFDLNVWGLDGTLFGRSEPSVTDLVAADSASAAR